MKKVFSAVIKYLSDWKNWLVHGLVGVALLVAIIWIPIDWWIKIVVLVCVVALNSVRMVISNKKKKKQKLESGDNSEEIEDIKSEEISAENSEEIKADKETKE